MIRSLRELETIHKPHITTYVRLLQECIRNKALDEGRRVHNHLWRNHAGNVRVNNLLVHMYATCGCLQYACSVFDNMQERNVYSWNIMLNAYTQKEHLQNAKKLFDEMPERNAVSWNTTIAGFASSFDVDSATVMFERMPGWDVYSTNTLIAAFAQNGEMHRAQVLFNTMLVRDAVSWNTLLQGYVQCEEMYNATVLFDKVPKHSTQMMTAMITVNAQSGHLDKAVNIFEEMLDRNVFTWNAMLRAFLVSARVEDGNLLFELTPQRDLVTWNAILTTRRKDAYQSFVDMPERDVVSWTTLLCSCIDEENSSFARNVFDRMPQMNIVSWTAMLGANATMGELSSAKDVFDAFPVRDMVSWNTMAFAYAQSGQLHDVKRAFDLAPNRNTASWNILLQSYCQNGHQMEEAKAVFDTMPVHDVVSWNSVIGGYANVCFAKALKSFGLMDLEGVKPDRITYLVVVEAFSNFPTASEAQREAIRESIVNSWFANDVAVVNSLVSMYGKYKEDQMKYLFHDMHLQGVRPNDITYVSMLDACASSANVLEGQALHTRTRLDMCDVPTRVSNALINMYSKCGRVEDACAVFQGMCTKDCITWSTLVSGLAWNGHGEQSVVSFHTMLLDGMDVNEVTMLSVVSSCSHAGLVELGRQYFLLMFEVLELNLAVKHYACMVDLLSRAGRLEEAEELAKYMPFEATFSSWMSLLASCNNLGDVEVGARVAQVAIELNSKCQSPYLALC